MNYTKSQRELYNEHRQYVLKALNITQNQYNYIRRIGEQLHSLYEQSCNGTIDEQTYETQTTDLENKLSVYIYPNLHYFLQTDPRGATIYLDTKAIPNNNYNNASCIY